MLNVVISGVADRFSREVDKVGEVPTKPERVSKDTLEGRLEGKRPSIVRLTAKQLTCK